MINTSYLIFNEIWMRIKKIEVNNFRSLQNCIVEFYDLRKPITIIWENNAWKSNIIKSILYWTWYKYIWEDWLSENDFFNKDLTKKILINTTLEINNEEKLISFSSWDNIKDSPKLTLNWTQYYKNQKDPIINKIFYYDFQSVSNLLKVKTDFSYTPLWKSVRKIKNKFRDNPALQASVQEKINNFINDVIATDQEYQEFRGKIWEKLKKNLKNHSNDFVLQHTIQDVDKIINWLSFFVQENENKPLISVDNFWNWFRSLLVFSIFEAISESEEWWNIFIFEEPETFLHENFEEYFFELLQKLAENNQVIITTHSKKFVDVFNVWTIVRLHNNNDTNYKTKVYQREITDEIVKNINDKVLSENNVSLVKFPDEYWTYMKAVEPNIWLIAFSEKILIVEWPHDVLGYKTAFEKWLLEQGYSKSLWYLWVNIICVHNKDLIWPLMYICSELKTKAFIIFDSDLKKDQLINEDDNFFDEKYKSKEPYSNLEIKRKQHYTKTIKLISIAKRFNFWYQINKPKIEEVLNFEIDDDEKLTYKKKSSLEVYNKLKDKTYNEIKTEFPEFITSELENFIFWDILEWNL